MNNYFILCLLLLFALTVHGEELVKFPEGPASWTVTFKSSELGGDSTHGLKPSDEREPVRPVSIEVHQDETKRQSVIHFSNGMSRTTWSLPEMNLYLTEDPSGKSIIISQTGYFEVPFSPATFNWIKMKYLQNAKPINYDGADCYYYKGMVRNYNRQTEVHDDALPHEAWIDSATRLPVAMDNGILLGKFEFSPLKKKLTLPQKFKKKADYYKTMMGVP